MKFQGLEVVIGTTTVTINSFKDVCTALEGLAASVLQEAVEVILANVDIPVSIEKPLALEACLAVALGIN